MTALDGETEAGDVLWHLVFTESTPPQPGASQEHLLMISYPRRSWLCHEVSTGDGVVAELLLLLFNNNSNNNPRSAELVSAVPTHRLTNKYASFPLGSARSSFAPARNTTPASSGTGEQYLPTPPLRNTRAK